MSLTGRIARRFGYDTTTEYTKEKQRYRYEVLHTNGETAVFEADSHSYDEAFASFRKYTDVYYVRALNDIYGRKSIEKRLGSVQEIRREPVDTVSFRMEIDTADNTVLEKVLVE